MKLQEEKASTNLHYITSKLMKCYYEENDVAQTMSSFRLIWYIISSLSASLGSSSLRIICKFWRSRRSSLRNSQERTDSVMKQTGLVGTAHEYAVSSSQTSICVRRRTFIVFTEFSLFCKARRVCQVNMFAKICLPFDFPANICSAAEGWLACSFCE